MFYCEIKNVSNFKLYGQEDVRSNPGIQSSLMTTTPVNGDSLKNNSSGTPKKRTGPNIKNINVKNS